MNSLVERAARFGIALAIEFGPRFTMNYGDWWRRVDYHESEVEFFIASLERGATLDAADYVTEFDVINNDNYAEKQYAKARTMAEGGAIVHIGANGVWSASTPNKYARNPEFCSETRSYERIGYHAHTDALVRGWQDGGALIADYRR